MYTTATQMRQEFDERRRALGFADSNVWIGSALEPVFTNIETIEDLTALLDRALIAEALVSHSACISYDFAAGNELLLSTIEGRDRFHAAIALVPDSVGEVGGIESYLDRAISRKARAVRLFPKTHSFSLAEWCSGPLLRAIGDRGMPLILRHTEATWDEIHDLCARYPDLSIIIEGVGRKILYDNRVFYAMLAEHKSLMLELHNLTNYLIVEDIVRRFGPERLVFGSFAPVHEPSAAMMIVTHARIPEEHKKLIADGNLRRLMRAVRR